MYSGTGNPNRAAKTRLRSELKADNAAYKKAMADAARYAVGPPQVDLLAAPVAGRVLYRCPLVNPQLRLPRDEMEKEIERFLLSQLTEEPAMTAALMIWYCFLILNTMVD